MALPASDAFTAANGTSLTTYNPSWTFNAPKTYNINTNAVYDNGSGVDFAAHWNADTFDNDQYAQATLTALGGEQIGVAVRIHATVLTYYGFYTDGSAGWTQLGRNVNGTWTQLGSAGAVAWSVDDVIRIEVTGAAPNIIITPYRNGSIYTSIGAQTDATIASGSGGITSWSGSTATREDDWSAGNLAGGPTQYTQTVAGTLTDAGALLKQARTVKIGTLTSAGALLNRSGKIAVGGMTSAGALLNRAGKFMAGMLTDSGAIVRQTQAQRSGALTSSGAIAKQTSTARTGTLTSSSVLTTIKTFLLNVLGTLGLAGILTRSTDIAQTGTATSNGALTRQTHTARTGTLISSGALNAARVALLTLAGNLTSTGSVIKQSVKNIAGTLASTGGLTKRIGRALTGALDWIGDLIRVIGGLEERGTVCVSDLALNAVEFSDIAIGSVSLLDVAFGQVIVTDGV